MISVIEKYVSVKGILILVMSLMPGSRYRGLWEFWNRVFHVGYTNPLRNGFPAFWEFLGIPRNS